MSETAVATFRFRLRDKHAAELNRQARAVSFVWNYCNETQKKAATSGRQWLSAINLQYLTAGSSRELNIHAHTIQQVCRWYARSRERCRRPYLRFRGAKSLGWVPFNTGHVTFNGNAFFFRGVQYRPMDRRALAANATILAGSFSQDAKGHWYINAPVKQATADHAPNTRVGIDLGLKSLATLSTGATIEAPRFYRQSEALLASSQRGRKSKRTRAIHAKIANRRRDYLHKTSTAIAKEFGLIVVGDVSPTKLAKTTMAKSIHDAGWSNFKRLLSYKAIMHGGSVIEVSERLTTQTCSECGALPPSRPAGIAGLHKRVWQCDDCGAVHDRDVNAARNILRLGQQTLAGGARV